MNGAREIARQIGDLTERVTEAERRLVNILRIASVTDVDVKKGLVKVNASDLPSPWLPWSEEAGDISTWSPPSKGQQVKLLSPSGDPAQGWVDKAGFSDANPAKHDKGGEHKLTVGNASFLIKEGKIDLVVGGANLSIENDKIEIKVGGSRVVVTGDEIVTHGKTRLNNGTKPIHRIGDLDDGGDKAIEGADEALA